MPGPDVLGDVSVGALA
jgi:hypothetical protein